MSNGSLKMDDYNHHLSTKLTIIDSASAAAPVLSATMSNMFDMLKPFVTNVELAWKQYPLFNEDTNQWTKYKQGVLAIAAVHSLEDVLDIKFVVPDHSQFVWRVF